MQRNDQSQPIQPTREATRGYASGRTAARRRSPFRLKSRNTEEYNEAFEAGYNAQMERQSQQTEIPATDAIIAEAPDLTPAELHHEIKTGRNAGQKAAERCGDPNPNPDKSQAYQRAFHEGYQQRMESMEERGVSPHYNRGKNQGGIVAAKYFNKHSNDAGGENPISFEEIFESVTEIHSDMRKEDRDNFERGLRDGFDTYFINIAKHGKRQRKEDNTAQPSLKRQRIESDNEKDVVMGEEMNASNEKDFVMTEEVNFSEEKDAVMAKEVYLSEETHAAAISLIISIPARTQTPKAPVTNQMPAPTSAQPGYDPRFFSFTNSNQTQPDTDLNEKQQPSIWDAFS